MSEIILGSKQLPRNTAKRGGKVLAETAQELDYEIWVNSAAAEAFEAVGESYRSFMEENFDITPQITEGGEYRLLARLKY